MKQQMVAENLLDNAGNVSKTMLKVGYSPKSAKDPQRLTKSKSWPELLEKYFPDDKLLDKHNEILDSEDSLPRLRALDMAYKLKNKYPATAVDVSGTVAVVNVVKFGDDTPVEAEIVRDVVK